ncbi:hypothetical protein E3N88_09876 [Mikania micrantha]|uniref:Leucine-rich repeat-containing N-terminal plant-type domain-containing protein n=1 Tax=Mikania micrantha TaxID=192012 RepID=A0A5N6PKB0_9ASTR|nr:hypothetical protein E3N88_09876 [Mikania micrantha]
MESWCFVKHKASLLIFMMLLIFMVGWAQGIYIEDERKALLEIKASLLQVSNFLNVENLLPTWVDHGKYCDWERIKCNTTSGFVTDLSLGNMFSMEDSFYASDTSHVLIWPLNASLFLNFKELRRLDLSWNYIGNMFVSSGLERLSELKRLENLNLGYNFIETNIFPSLSELTSLKILNLTSVNVNVYDMTSPPHDLSEFRISENLEVLDLTRNGCYGTLQMQVHGSLMAREVDAAAGFVVSAQEGSANKPNLQPSPSQPGLMLPEPSVHHDNSEPILEECTDREGKEEAGCTCGSTKCRKPYFQPRLMHHTSFFSGDKLRSVVLSCRGHQELRVDAKITQIG